MLFLTAHPWVREGGNASDIPIDISVLSNIREFVKFSRFKQFALRVHKFQYFLGNQIVGHINFFFVLVLYDYLNLKKYLYDFCRH